MHPELFHIGPFALRSFGLMLAISFFVGILYIRRRAFSERVDVNFVLNLAFVVIFTGILGARLFYVLFHWSEFSHDLLSAINPFRSGGEFGIAGLNLYGGIVMAIAATLVYVRMRHQPLWKIVDIFAPAVAIGIFISRIGCFLNGCCFGIPGDLPFCFPFPEGSLPHYHFGDQPLHPTQLYSSLYGLLLFFTLHFFDKRKSFYGATFCLMLMIEAVFRFLIEYVRYYETEMVTQLFGVTFTYNHLIAVGLFLLGLVLWLVLRNRPELVTGD
jgi:phosphatidylglycerol:prolipoprotein diacylglycerol transferase